MTFPTVNDRIGLFARVAGPLRLHLLLEQVVADG